MSSKELKSDEVLIYGIKGRRMPNGCIYYCGGQSDQGGVPRGKHCNIKWKIFRELYGRDPKYGVRSRKGCKAL